MENGDDNTGVSYKTLGCNTELVIMTPPDFNTVFIFIVLRVGGMICGV